MLNLTYKQFRNSIVWVSDFYDWSLSGCISISGKSYWFKCTKSGYELTGEIDEEDCPVSQEYKVFSIYNCPWDWWEPVLARHKDFEEMVGTHWNYKDGKRISHYTDNGTTRQFYEKYKDWKYPSLNNDWIIENVILDWIINVEIKRLYQYY